LAGFVSVAVAEHINDTWQATIMDFHPSIPVLALPGGNRYRSGPGSASVVGHSVQRRLKTAHDFGHEDLPVEPQARDIFSARHLITGVTTD
jgi:hypothetical protein